MSLRVRFSPAALPPPLVSRRNTFTAKTLGRRTPFRVLDKNGIKTSLAGLSSGSREGLRQNMLSSTSGVSLGILFVAIAGTNVWSMLRASRPSQRPDSRASLMRLHRFGGYLFLTLFSVMFFYMNLRVLGVRHGLTIAITVHSALAFLLVPLLLMKVLIARHYKQYSGALLALGLAIFVVSFLLVSITSFPVLWASVTVENVPLGVCISVIA
jgi:hypothetical protein